MSEELIIRLRLAEDKRIAVQRFLKYRGSDHSPAFVAREIASSRPELGVTPAYVESVRINATSIRREVRQKRLRAAQV